MPSVLELLEGRSDLSTFLVHFTRTQDDRSTGRSVLLKILNDQNLKATRVHGIAKSRLEGSPVEQLFAVVCMSEAPMAHWSMLCAEIPGRTWRFAPYGLVFTKDWARRLSFNPVWYLNTLAGQDWLTTPLNDLADIAISGQALAKNDEGALVSVRFRDSQVAKLLPFIETAGVGKDFSWEREWRRVGSVSFLPRETVAVLVPEEDQPSFKAEYEQQCAESGWSPTPLNLVDPAWPLTRIKSAIEM